MSYLKQIWRDLVSGGTTLTADRLNHMEDGIAAANDAWDSVAPADLGGHWSILQLPDNYAILTFWDSFTLLKAGENRKVVSLPKRAESCLYAGLSMREDSWMALNAYIDRTDVDTINIVAWPNGDSAVGKYFNYQLVWVGKLA